MIILFLFEHRDASQIGLKLARGHLPELELSTLKLGKSVVCSASICLYVHEIMKVLNTRLRTIIGISIVIFEEQDSPLIKVCHNEAHRCKIEHRVALMAADWPVAHGSHDLALGIILPYQI